MKATKRHAYYEQCGNCGYVTGKSIIEVNKKCLKCGKPIKRYKNNKNIL